jgi:hypothetical protein
MIELLLALLVIHAWWARDSWLGVTTRDLVGSAIRWLASVRPLTIVCFLAVVAALAGLIAYGQVEGMIMAGLAAPESLAMFLAFDVGTAVEVVVIAWLAAGRGNLEVAGRYLRSARSAIARGTRPRARKARVARKAAKPANDDEPGIARPGPVLALAA